MKIRWLVKCLHWRFTSGLLVKSILESTLFRQKSTWFRKYFFPSPAVLHMPPPLFSVKDRLSKEIEQNLGWGTHSAGITVFLERVLVRVLYMEVTFFQDGKNCFPQDYWTIQSCHLI